MDKQELFKQIIALAYLNKDDPLEVETLPNNSFRIIQPSSGAYVTLDPDKDEDELTLTNYQNYANRLRTQNLNRTNLFGAKRDDIDTIPLDNLPTRENFYDWREPHLNTYKAGYNKNFQNSFSNLEAFNKKAEEDFTQKYGPKQTILRHADDIRKAKTLKEDFGLNSNKSGGNKNGIL